MGFRLFGCFIYASGLTFMLVQQVILSGWVETEERIWLKRKWFRNYATLDEDGVLRISSPSVYEKREYTLLGGHVVLVSGEVPCHKLWSKSISRVNFIFYKISRKTQSK